MSNGLVSEEQELGSMVRGVRTRVPTRAVVYPRARLGIWPACRGSADRSFGRAIACRSIASPPAIRAGAKLSKKGGDLCPICTLIGLAGSLLPLSPPTLSLPVVVAGSVLSIAADRERILSPPNLFQARAPPIA